MLEYSNEKQFVLFGDSLADVAAHIKATTPKWNARDSVLGETSWSWDLSTGWERALEMARIGWTEGAQDLFNRLATIPPNIIEAEWTWDVAGGDPDIPTFLAGDPEHMRDFGHPLGRKPTVHLVINAVASARVGAEEYKNYGTAILAIVDQLENDGRSVEVDIVFMDTLRGGTALLGWKIKRAGDAADLSAIAYSMAHPAAFRRIGFAMIERTPREWEMSGYGHCAGLDKEFAALIDAEEAFLLDGIGTAYGACKTTQGALHYAAQQINKAAGETLVEVES